VSKQPERWIDIPRWKDFQHYKNREPYWIKDWRRQLHDPKYIDQPLATRGVLHGLRLLRSEVGEALSESYAKRALVGSESDARYWRVHLDRLNHAGLIALLSSKPLATETETEKEKENPSTGNRKTGKTTADKSNGTNPKPFGNLAPELLQLPTETPVTGQKPIAHGFDGAVLDLLRFLRRQPDSDDRTEATAKGLIKKHRLAEGHVRYALEMATSPGVRSPVKMAMHLLANARDAA
jgi:hypothetical protein